MGLHALAVGLVTATAAAPQATPPLIWRDVQRVQILCNVASDRPAERQALQYKLCERARALAAQGSPAPVSVIPLGDPAVLAPGAATLLVHGSVQPGARGGRLLALSVRPYRVSAEQTNVLFGAPPRAIDLSGGDAAVDAALAAMLSDLLPWRAKPGGARPIP